MKKLGSVFFWVQDRAREDWYEGPYLDLKDAGSHSPDHDDPRGPWRLVEFREVLPKKPKGKR